ncbi:uncharacterized protein LOC127748618 [Frankliniella occidentalis]|uniref:Uncharacterized protein LOC127748618 n=1 Tax=Frankliniella occidentalis TaxID=133901 RepID=A0A9C6XV64_FRAOC|nr:uncharacterized protein LOC127748618 [Frankliniella occidentalis]
MSPSVSSAGAAACVALALLLVSSTVAAPAASSTTTSAPAPAPVAAMPENTPLQPGEEFYDQRQNGSENYRIHMDGMVVVVAPPEALMSVAGAAGAAGGQGGQLEQQLLDIVAQQQAAGVEDNDVKPGKPGAKPPQPCVEGTPGCKKRRPAGSLPAKS